MVWDWRIPDIHEINRALAYITWCRQRGIEFAHAEYAKQYTTVRNGELPCFAKDDPSHLGAAQFAVRALWRLQNNSRKLT